MATGGTGAGGGGASGSSGSSASGGTSGGAGASGGSDGGASGGASGSAAQGGAGASGGAGGNAGGSGAAGKDGAGGAGGASGDGGVVVRDAATDGRCGRSARTYAFTRQDVRPLGAGSLNAGLVLLQGNGTPTLIYAAGSAPQYRIWAAHLPETSDGGISVSLAYQISRGEVGGGVTGPPQVRTAQNGEIRFAYMEQYNAVYTARYVTWNGDFAQAPNDVTVGSYNLQSYSPIAFALDPQDHPGLVYFATDHTVVFAKNDGGGWQMTTLESQTTQVLTSSLAFDGNGVPSAFWNGMGYGGELSGFVVTSLGSSGWSSAQFDPQNIGGDGLIAGRDGNGQVEIFYFVYPADLRAIGTAGAWTLGASVPDRNTGFGEATSVAFGAGGEVHLAYVDFIQGVMYAYFDGCSWSTQVVDSDTTVGDQLQIALDSAGAPHFSYQSKSILAKSNPAAGELWYASPAP